jgi:hypothetical protein
VQLVDAPPPRVAVLREAGSQFADKAFRWRRLFPDLYRRQLNLLTKAERERRTEVLEAIVLVVRALLRWTDLCSLRVGKPWEKRGRRYVHGLPLRTIAKWTGLEVRRVQRALYELRYAGYVAGPGLAGPNIIRQPVDAIENELGEVIGYRGCPAVRRVTLLFFERLGLAGWLRQSQADRVAQLASPARAGELVDLAAARENARSVKRLTLALAAKAARERPPDSG